MYEGFFGLRCRPFADVPDLDFLFKTEQHAEGLRLLDEAMAERGAISLVTGDVGCGKTTLIQAFLNDLGDEVSVCRIPNAHPALQDLSRWMLAGFGLPPSGMGPGTPDQELARVLAVEERQGRVCLVIVDEAQNLSPGTLDELRALLSGVGRALHLILVGETALRERLSDPASAAPLPIALSLHLHALTFQETLAYVRSRLATAGADHALFSDRAVAGTHLLSNGIPRMINRICDLALVYAFADGIQTIDLDIIERVVADRRASGLRWETDSVPGDAGSMERAVGGLLDQLLPPVPPGAMLIEAQLDADEIEPPLAEIEPPFAEIEPPFAEIEPPFAEIEPTLAETEPPLAMIEVKLPEQTASDGDAVFQVLDTSPELSDLARDAESPPAPIELDELVLSIEVDVPEDLPAAPEPLEFLPVDDIVETPLPAPVEAADTVRPSISPRAELFPVAEAQRSRSSRASDPNQWPSILGREGIGGLARFNTARPDARSARIALRRRFLPRD